MYLYGICFNDAPLIILSALSLSLCVCKTRTPPPAALLVTLAQTSTYDTQLRINGERARCTGETNKSDSAGTRLLHTHEERPPQT